jgi:hypothetical protein
MGRRKIEINPAEVYELARKGAKIVEIAELFQVDRDTISDNFSAELRKAKFDIKQSLRSAQLDTATKYGNPTMQIWLGKQLLGQSDKSIDEYILEAIEEAGITKEELLDLVKRKDELNSVAPKRSFHEFCAKAGYAPPFDKQVEMMEFGITGVDPRLLLGARGYGKTEYITVLGISYKLYLDHNWTSLIITKSRDRNTALLGAIQDVCMKNGMLFDKANSTALRVRGLHGKEDSVGAVPIGTKSLRGRHPDLTIMDDPVTEDDVSEATRTQARRVLNEVMKLSKNVLLIGQPAHQYDLYADVRGNIRTMEVPYGTIPELDHDLEAQRLAGVSEASISASYFLKVLSEGTTPFDKVKYMNSFPTGGTAVAFIDPSEGGDYTAITILKAHMEGVAAVGFVWKKAWNHCLDDMAPMLAKYGVKKLAFETNCTGDMPVELLQGLWKGIGIVGRRASTNKHARIMAAGTYAHMIHLSKESGPLYLSHVTKYEYKSKFDDAPDSLASCLEWLGLIRGRK